MQIDPQQSASEPSLSLTTRREQAAFTILEVILVIGILVLFVALLIPYFLKKPE